MYVPGDHSYDKRRGVSIAPCLPLGIRCYYCQFPTRTNTQNEKKRASDGGKDWSFTRIDKHIRKPINAKLQTELKCKYRNRFRQNYEMRTTKLKRKKKRAKKRFGFTIRDKTSLYSSSLDLFSSLIFTHSLSLSLECLWRDRSEEKVKQLPSRI